jgi:hypothetical protein
MFTAGSATGGTHPQEERPEVTEKTLTEKLADALWRVLNKQEFEENRRLEARRYRDPNARGPDPDAPPVTAEDLERLIKRIAREQEPGFRMGNYQEGEKSWKDWILGLVGLLIVAWLGRLSYQLDSLQALVAKQAVTDQRLERLETRVFRSAP